MKKKRFVSWLLAVVMVLGLLPATAWAEEMPFTAQAGEETLQVTEIEDGYTYEDKWNPVDPGEKTVPLYQVEVPAGVEKVTLDFGQALLAYAYDQSGDYVAAYADYGDGTTGQETAVIADGFENFARVQTPYDETWNSEVLYAVQFDAEELPFSAKADGEELSVTRAETDYEYTVVLEYDENGKPIKTEKRQVTQFEVEVPAETETIGLTFEEDRLAYGYGDKEDYIASYGSGEDGAYENGGQTGEKTATIRDTFPSYVWVQTPYDSNWNSEFLYAIHLLTEETEEPEEPEGEVSAEELMENIADSYADSSKEWEVMDMAAYADLNPDGAKTSDAAKQKYISTAIRSVATEGADDGTYAKAILSLTAIGIDAEKLYKINSNDPISAVAGLMKNGENHSSSAWVAPYILMAYNQNEYEGTDAIEDALIDAVLENQGEDGSWTEWGSIQATSNMIAGLSFYYEDRADVKDAVDRAVAYLSDVWQEQGYFDDGYGPDANTMAMVVIALSACGINADTDERFINRDGDSVLDALLAYGLADNSGFGYQDNTVKNPGATEQGFRALIAASQVMETGEAFNIYDFSYHADSLIPGRETSGDDGEEIPTPPEENEDITVTVSIKADGEYWLRKKSVTVKDGSTVYHAFMEAIEDTDIEQEGASKGYITSISKDGEELAEFDRGENSGWLYKVNGDLPDAGIKDYDLEDGDSILFYYTDDWTKDPDAGSNYQEMIEEENKEAAEKVDDLIDKIGEVTIDDMDAIKAAREAYDDLTEEQKELVENYDVLLEAEAALEALLKELQTEELPALEDIYTDVSADAYYYEAAQWAVAEGIVTGVTETEFGPEWTCSRGQLMTFLWRMKGSPAPATKAVPYIDVADDMYYRDAVLWATENKLANGTDAISFSPEMVLSRGQAVTFLWRMAGCPTAEGTVAFTDVAEGAYYSDAILWAVENEITSGTGDGMFSPELPCTRGQIVTFLYRAFAE